MRIAGLLLGLALGCAATAHAAPLEAYGRLPSIEQIEISPDGKRVALVSTQGDARLLSIIDVATRSETPHARLGEVKLRDLSWVGENHLLATTSRTALIPGFEGPAREYSMVTLLDLRTGKQTNPLDRAESALNVIVSAPQVRTIEGRHYLFNVGAFFASNRGSYAVYKTDVETGRTTRIEDGTPETRSWLIDAQGEPVAHTTYDERRGKWALRIKQDSRWIEVQSTTALLERPSLVGLGRDGRSLLLVESSESKSTLEELTFSTEPVATQLTGEFIRLFRDPTSQKLLGVVSREGDKANYQFFDPTAGSTWNAILKAFPNARVTLTSWSNDRRKIIVHVDEPKQPPAYALVDLDAKTADWLGPVHNDLTAADIGEMRPVKYRAADSLEISGYLTLPPGSTGKNLPLIVLPHGGPAVRDILAFDWLGQAIASRGYAVLQPNYRGSDGFGWSFLSAGFGEWGGKMQTDLSDGVGYLAAEGIVDPKRVCIVGASYGGYAALAGVALQSDIYRCAISIAGISDLKQQMRSIAARTGTTAHSALRFWDRFLGISGASDPKLDRISPAQHVAKIAVPVMLIHGRDDTVVTISQSRTMAAAMQRAGREVVFQELKGEDHWLSRSDTRLEMLSGLIGFLEKHNPPGPPSTLASAAQIP